ncbi:hypothetical protein [Micromonospora sp. CPCC 206061]|uniref:hypothetical protein n=1 Tax=Micromonospora sp. CPCC 206061 TaxID=3122410 RepID=UPI002FF27011
MSPPSRWEVGSAFPLVLPAEGRRIDAPDGWRLFGSGRQALTALLDFGRRKFGWKRVNVPTYYCPEVVTSITGVLPVRRYAAGPTVEGESPVPDPGDVVITVSYFGAAPPVWSTTGSASIIDATHDPLAPWLHQLKADYVFASLRKTLPLPDGGAVWSSNQRELPPDTPPTAEHMATVGTILSAMSLKAAYLSGACVDKDVYLSLYATGEDGLRSRQVSGISDYSRQALGILPASELRRRRIDNACVLGSLLASLEGVTVHSHTFGVVLEYDSPDVRDLVRRGLIERHVYPAVLWSHSPELDLPNRRACFSRRMLFLHTDFRWNRHDVERVAAIARAATERSMLTIVGRCGSSSAINPAPTPRTAASPC